MKSTYFSFSYSDLVATSAQSLLNHWAIIIAVICFRLRYPDDGGGGRSGVLGPRSRAGTGVAAGGGVGIRLLDKLVACMP